jgi:hypothetical protein
VKYWALISYSHKDSAVADWLHKKLETYRVPRSLVGAPSRDGTVPERLIPIFRDREELPTSSQLGDNLKRSLEQSRYLVVVCSPAAAQSRWVEEEIRAFKGWKGRDRIIALIASGVPNASDGTENDTECFPYSLRFEGDGVASTPVRVEPIAADLRPEGDGRERAFLKIVAGLLGVGFDDLYQREKRRHQRRQVLVGALAAICLLALIGIYWSIARLGRSQNQIRQEVVNVRQDAAVATTEYKDVRPKNREAEKRLRDLAQQAENALVLLEQSHDRPDAEYQAAYNRAQKAVVALVQEAKSTDESIFAAELQKPLLTRLMTAGTEMNREIIRRTMAKVKAVEDAAKRK